MKSNVYAACVLILTEEAPDQALGKNCETPEENEKQHQQSNTEIKITVKDEEKGPVNGKANCLKQPLI